MVIVSRAIIYLILRGYAKENTAIGLAKEQKENKEH